MHPNEFELSTCNFSAIKIRFSKALNYWAIGRRFQWKFIANTNAVGRQFVHMILFGMEYKSIRVASEQYVQFNKNVSFQVSEEYRHSANIPRHLITNQSAAVRKGSAVFRGLFGLFLTP